MSPEERVISALAKVVEVLGKILQGFFGNLNVLLYTAVILSVLIALQWGIVYILFLNIEDPNVFPTLVGLAALASVVYAQLAAKDGASRIVSVGIMWAFNAVLTIVMVQSLVWINDGQLGGYILLTLSVFAWLTPLARKRLNLE